MSIFVAVLHSRQAPSFRSPLHEALLASSSAWGEDQDLCAARAQLVAMGEGSLGDL